MLRLAATSSQADEHERTSTDMHTTSSWSGT